MKIYYSSSLKGFVCDEIHESIPSDAVEISIEEHQNLLNSQDEGKEIVPDENGYPISITPIPPTPTWEEIREKRNILLSSSDWSVLSDSNPSPSKEAWISYRQELRDIPQKFSTPEEVIWPEKPE